MASHNTSAHWGQLHTAITRSCTAWGDGPDHHRACVADIRAETRPDLAGWIAVFNASAEAGEKARAEGQRRAAA